jgi:hypothetical protein
VNPDPDGEAGPSDGIVPAAPLDLDLRQGRIRARSDEPERRRERASAGSTESVGLGDTQPDRDHSEAKGEVAAQSVTDRREAPAAKEAEPATLSERSALADEALAANRGADDSLGAIDSPSPAPDAPTSPSAYSGIGYGQATGTASRKSRGASLSPGVELEMAEAAETTGGAAPRPAAARPPTPSSSSTSSETARTGADVVAVPEGAGELPALESLLALARTYQRSGRCDAAVVQYEAFLKRAPRHRDAMLEAARCYQQLGRMAEATRWTKRADTITPVATSPRATPAAQPATSVQGQ